MAAFPSYAKILYDGYAEQRQSALIRTEMEDGPPKQAKIRSRVMVTRPITVLLQSKADYLSFITWFSETIHEGADWFDFTDPVSQTVKQARLVGDGIEGRPKSGMLAWTISTSLETWG